MDIHPWVWAVTITTLLAVIAVDFIIIARRPHEPSMREAAIWIGVYVSLAIVFGIGIGIFSTPSQSLDFFTGWIVEYSMSVDNLFVFILILGSFAVPAKHRQRVLLVGIALALLFRGLFIALGAAVVNAFAGVFFIFGAFLLFTAWKLIADAGGEDEEYKENAAVRMVRRLLPTTDKFHEAKLTVRLDGKRVVTPMLLVMIAVGLTDILFALDSIPAIFGITQEPYLVFTANAFALMGLRQLYFLIGGLLTKLVHLNKGLAVILGFIGLKLILHALHETTDWHVPEIGTLTSLFVIIATLAVTTVTSLLSSRKTAAAEAAEAAGVAARSSEGAGDTDTASRARTDDDDEVGTRTRK
ncbi:MULTISPECIES: TerC family protein [Nocardiopsis]|uniref:Tellurite resistance protein TerC n=1 Tax=Nocardiopsis sinuspersici TaxID=501010 RepID=A0A1V3C4T7_9ACTN|nr:MULTISPECIES: TerC family protein [Nocardiopsis]NYH52102.1 tellurite resistance protein TerC [Nocardiopsis sinuspersici]OOC55648.1 tellurium resistance protein TerC [Nocardiopsis sinuspersici]